MIHYHGCPITPEHASAAILAGRHAMVSFAHPRQIELVAFACQSFALDNGAFSAWRSGKPITDWQPYYEWVAEWFQHPGCDWFLLPDVIDGDERANDALIGAARFGPREGAVPIWHLHESTDRLNRLREWGFGRIAIGSSGEYAQIATGRWWSRMAEAMQVLCNGDGVPLVRLHGLRMLAVDIFTRFPFASADSTNVAQNVGLDGRWKGTYQPANKAGRGVVLADRIEAYQSPARWDAHADQAEMSFGQLEVPA